MEPNRHATSGSINPSRLLEINRLMNTFSVESANYLYTRGSVVRRFAAVQQRIYLLHQHVEFIFLGGVCRSQGPEVVDPPRFASTD